MQHPCLPRVLPVRLVPAQLRPGTVAATGTAGRTGARHAMAVNETIAAFVLGGTATDAPGGVGTVADWATEVEYALAGGWRKVRPDAVWQGAETGVPVLMVEADRSTMSPERVAAKFTAYRELFRAKVRSTDPVLAYEEPEDRMVHWWRRTWPDHDRPGYPPVALVFTGAGPTAWTTTAPVWPPVSPTPPPARSREAPAASYEGPGPACTALSAFGRTPSGSPPGGFPRAAGTGVPATQHAAPWPPGARPSRSGWRSRRVSAGLRTLITALCSAFLGVPGEGGRSDAGSRCRP
ncbi:replication-relaxation family protein [Kitasatospora sp. NBC_00070]|uniref:replication-relaxation family protein n=1 Tax=Kitasatospora sp. NBC_00070 TaxID=2975962 RepID=UPI002F914BC7